MAKKPNIYIEIDGPLFDMDVIDKLNDAVAKGIEDLGNEAAGIMAGVVSRGGFVQSGAFLRSIDSMSKRTKGAGYAKVAPTAVWPDAGRPTKTWAETGYRSGKKLRKGLGIFRNTTTHTQAMAYDRFFVDRIVQALS